MPSPYHLSCHTITLYTARTVVNVLRNSGTQEKGKRNGFRHVKTAGMMQGSKEYRILRLCQSILRKCLTI